MLIRSGPYKVLLIILQSSVVHVWSCIIATLSYPSETEALNKSSPPTAPPPNSNTCTARGGNNSILGAGVHPYTAI